jgi:heparan-alpha-glucosaminide N-acetyltransferase
MSTITSAAPHPLATQTVHPHRIVSLDILRGLNVALMIFVNELAEVKGLPWWTYHAPGTIDAMTYVDMVFPGFLFILGMAIPLALQARIKKGYNSPALLGHITLRSVALVVLGIILANGSQEDPDLMHGIGRFAWGLTALLAACLIWFSYPKSEEKFWRNVYHGLRLLGFVILIALAAIYRHKNRDGSVGWLSYGYPEILGLIGYTYFAVSLLYLATRRWLWAPAVWFVAFTAFNVACSGHYLNIHLPWYEFPLQNGSMPCITFAGITLTTIFFLEPRLDTFRKKAIPSIIFGVLSLVAARLLYSFGISKIRATPTWCLYAIGATVLLFLLLYFICDVKHHTKWAFWVRSAGSNTLLTYLLPDFWYYILGITSLTYLNTHFNWGAWGIARALVFTVLVLSISAVLTKMRLRLQL